MSWWVRFCRNTLVVDGCHCSWLSWATAVHGLLGSRGCFSLLGGDSFFQRFRSGLWRTTCGRRANRICSGNTGRFRRVRIRWIVLKKTSRVRVEGGHYSASVVSTLGVIASYGLKCAHPPAFSGHMLAKTQKVFRID